MKTRAAFLIQSTQLAKVARAFFSDLVCIKSAAKNPFIPINSTQIKQESKYLSCDYMMM
jgi:hypothetical protein